MNYQISPRLKLIRLFLRPTFRLLFRVLADVKISGRDNIPSRGDRSGYIIAINHVSIFDPPFVLAFWPVTPEAVGAVEIWSKQGQSTLVSLYGAIPIQRGRYSRQSLETMMNVLRSGRPLVIAPEGGRSHQPGLRRGQPGIGFLLERVPVPVVPVGIVGTTEDFFEKAIRARRPRLEMNIGKPITIVSLMDLLSTDTDMIDDLHTLSGVMHPAQPIEHEVVLQEAPAVQRKQARQMIADRVMVEIAALLPRQYQGIYANPEEE